MLELPNMLRLDWIERHRRFWQLKFRTQKAVAARLSPCELLNGRWTGRKATEGSIIVLQDAPRPKPKQVKLKKLKQTRICKWLSMTCGGECCKGVEALGRVEAM